jgi:glycosyltransferase involved in cell wall biosynthesis
MKNPYTLILPCFNESDVIERLFLDIQQRLSPTKLPFLIILVDDGSTDSTVEIAQKFQFESEQFQLKIIRLRHNSGHQEAIRHGLHYAHSLQLHAKYYIVMDSDGEDDPAAIAHFLAQPDVNREIVLINRGNRKESLRFKIGYFIYRIIFHILTGRYISHGNFSIISDRVLAKIVHQPFIHYGSFLTKQKMDISYFTYDRAARIDNNPKMNFQSLVFHGLYSMIEFSEEILYSLMKLFMILIVTLGGVGCYVIYSKYLAFTAISGWTSGVAGSLFISLLVIISTVILGLILLSIKKILLQTSKNYDEV